MNNYQRAAFFRGCLNIHPTLTFEETATVLSKALGVDFREDHSGKYEEYPAYRTLALGLELALLAPPLPEDDLRDIRDGNFQLLIQTRARTPDPGVNIDLSAFIEAHLKTKTDLVIERVEHVDSA